MTADLLRRAAALMRERAAGSLDGPWIWQMDEDSGEQYVTAGPNGRDVATVNEWSQGLMDGAHIASWHPAVALAVADWIDDVHANLSTYNATREAHAFAVARAYLGESE